MSFITKDTFTFDHTAQADYPNWTPLQTKQNHNARGEELRLALNAVINLLNATVSGASGAKNVGMTPISAIGTQSDIQSVVEALITRLQAITAGASGAKFIGVETITGLTGNDVQTLLSALKTLADTYNTNQTNALNTHKTSTDHDGRYFTKTELGAISGAGLVGATAPSGLTGTTVQTLINALKTAIDNTVLGQIPDGSLTDVKLSNAAGQIKDTVTTHLADTAPHGATALATANKIALRDANGNVVSALPVTNGMNPNLLFNPTWALGSVGWRGIGSNGFSVEFSKEGAQLKNTTSPTATVQVDTLNNWVPANSDRTYTLSAEMYAVGVTAGSIGVQWFAFDSAKAAISGGALYAVNGQDWTKYSLTFTTPANTAYLQVACIVNANTTNTSVAWQKVKLEYGSVATTYSDDNTLNTIQYGDVLPLAQVLSGGNKVQSGVGPNMTVATAGTAVTAVVTFPVAFPGATTPNIYGFLAGTYADAGYINLKVIAGSPTDFTFQLNSYVAQTVGTYWLAIGT